MGDIGDYWRDVKAASRSYKNSPKYLRICQRNERRADSIVLKAEKFAEENDLIYSELAGYPVFHNRVKNYETGKFVDWWKSGSLRCVNGEYNYVGDGGKNLMVELKHLLDK